MIKMTKGEAIDYIHSHTREVMDSQYDKDRSGKGYVCPLCGSGSGRKGTGITSKDGVHYTCWSCGNFTNADVLDIYGLENDIEDKNKQLRGVADILGIDYDEHTSWTSSERAFGDLGKTEVKEKKEDAKPDYRSYYIEATKHLEETDYHRGISLDTLRRFNVGYDPKWERPSAGTDGKPSYPSKRLIIPQSNSSYLARAIDPKNSIQKMQVGSKVLFNFEALGYDRAPIFLVEGELDALSIIDVGGEAMALSSTSNADNFISEVLALPPSHPLIVALDNDGTGKNTAKKIIEKCTSEKISCINVVFPDSYKDANEMLMKDRAALERFVKESISAALKVQEEETRERDDEASAIELQSNAFAMDGFLRRIEDSKTNAPYISTGFKAIDEMLEGGLYAGLYTIGAVSSLGKTTFCLQIADQIAESGHDVLIFSLEMSRDELIAKSISRLTYQINNKKEGLDTIAKTTFGVMIGKRYANYSKEETDLIYDACERYRQDIASRLFVVEGMGNVTVADVRKKVEEMKRLRGAAPVVIIDYLQILAPLSDMMRCTDKQIVDKNVLELKRMSRDCKTPVIGISSFNRGAYKSEVSMEAFKESGAIEYSSDVLMGLQAQYDTKKDGTHSDQKAVDDKDNLLANDGKEIQITFKILKQRNGRKGEVDLKYSRMFNTYTEIDLDEIQRPTRTQLV